MLDLHGGTDGLRCRSMSWHVSASQKKWTDIPMCIISVSVRTARYFSVRRWSYDEYMSVNLAGVELKNPVMTASGTFGSGQEYSEFVDLNRLGAVVTKGVANVPWPGNPTPRVAETYWRNAQCHRSSESGN